MELINHHTLSTFFSNNKEAIEEFMIGKSDNPELTIDELKKELKIEKISEDDLKKIIQNITNKNLKIIKEKEMRAMGPLMGEVMKKVRGKIDGEIVSNQLKTILQKKIAELK